MHTNIHIHHVMKKVLNSVDSSSHLNRKDLIQRVQSTSQYDTKVKAEQFVSRQLFRLTRMGLISARGPHSNRTYQVSQELISILDSALPIYTVRMRLSKEEAVTSAHLDKTRAEVDAYLRLKCRYPSLKEHISELASETQMILLRLSAELEAIKRLINKVEEKCISLDN